MELTGQQITSFQETLWQYYAQHGRTTLPWRQPVSDSNFDPYSVMVSELMLQQTQVPRVIPKYHEFLAAFPDVQTLARAELGDVLRIWQGLGYNRRAKFIWQTAQVVHKLGAFPSTLETLVRLPGVGVNTAGAIMAYAYNSPVVFVETNIRTVYIHHFLAEQIEVVDQEIRGLIKQTIEAEHPREFYWALMDYGSHLKATVGNLNKVSKQYAKQSKFHGSRRQVRGQLIRILNQQPQTFQQLQKHIGDDRLAAVLKELVQEQLVREDHGLYRV